MDIVELNWTWYNVFFSAYRNDAAIELAGYGVGKLLLR